MSPQPVAIDLSPSGANAQTVSPGASLGGENAGVVIRATVVPALGAVPPHGRYYAQLVLCRQATYAVAAITAVLWSGYVTGSEPPSVGQLKVGLGEWAFLVVTGGSNGAATDTIRALITLDVPTGEYSWSPFYEVPGTGPGEQFTDSQSSSPGAENVFQALQYVRWRLREIRYKLVTSGVANNRSFTLDRKGKSPGFLQSSSLASYNPVQAASLTKFYSFKAMFITEGAKDQTATYPSLGEIVLNGQAGALGDRIVTNTANLDAGDQYTRAENYEEWAMPSP